MADLEHILQDQKEELLNTDSHSLPMRSLAGRAFIFLAQSTVAVCFCRTSGSSTSSSPIA